MASQDMSKPGEKGGKATSASGKRLTKAQQQMLDNGARLAQAINSGVSYDEVPVREEEASSSSSPPDPSSTEPSDVPRPSPTGDRSTDFLALVTASLTPPPQPNISPDLRTLLTCRPTRPPRPHHKQYEWNYNGHFEKLSRSFLREQLVSMYEELRNEEIGVLSGMDADLVGGKEAPGLPLLKRSAKKKEIIECILRQWGWPTMKEVRKEKKIRQENWKRVDKPFPLSPAEDYFLRREPNFIRDLAGRNMLNLTLARVPVTATSSSGSDDVDASTSGELTTAATAEEPTYKTQLMIKGRSFDVQQFESGVKLKFAKLREQTVSGEVFGPGLEQLYETISVMANAFVEKTEGGNVKISYMDPADRDRAIELLQAARRHLATSEPTSRAEIVALRPPTSDQPHALYPYLPPTAYVPSALSASSKVAKADVGSDWFLAGQSWFRIRRVGRWFERGGEEPQSDGIVTISGKVEAETLREFEKGDQPDWLKLVTTIEYGQLVFSSGNAGNTTWTPPIDGEKTLEELNKEISENSLSTVFLPGSVSPLHDVEAFAHPPLRRMRLRYEEEAEQLDSDWRPFMEVEYDLPESSGSRTVDDEEVSSIRGSTGREQVQYCLRPASDTDIRIRRRFNTALSPEEVPASVKRFCETLSADIAASSPERPPTEVTFDGKTFQLQSATKLDTYQGSEEAQNKSPIFEHPTDIFTGIKGSRMEEKIAGAQIATLHKQT